MLGIDDDLASSWYEKIGRRHRADGWIVGRATIQELVGNSKGKPKVRQSVGRIAREPHVAARRGRDVAVAIDPHGKVHHRTDNVGGDHLVAVLGEQVSTATLPSCAKWGYPTSSPVLMGTICTTPWTRSAASSD